MEDNENKRSFSSRGRDAASDNNPNNSRPRVGARPRTRISHDDTQRPRYNRVETRNNEHTPYSSERPRFHQDNNNSENRPFNRERRPYNPDARPRFGSDNRNSESRPFNRDNRERRPYNPDARPRFNRFNNDDNRNSESRPFNRDNRERRPYNPDARPRFNRFNNSENSEEAPRSLHSDRRSFQKGSFRSNNRFQNEQRRPYRPAARVDYHETNIDPTKPMRLNRFLANAGICSRREADDFIQAGVVTVNGEVVSTLGAKVLPTDKVMFHDQPVCCEHKVYILLNKPKDCVTTTDDPQERHTVMDLVRAACPERIYPVGRLDRNTTGVLLLTNDGDLAAKLTHPKFGKRKIYDATLDKDLTEEDMQTIMAGISLDDEVIVPDDLQFTKENDRRHIGLEIHSGQNRVVRRIFEKVGYKVMRLDRVSFAGLTKKGVPRGKYRFLTPQEVSILKMGSFE